MTVLGLLTTTYGAPSAREDLESLLLGGWQPGIPTVWRNSITGPGPQSTVWCSPT